jgi:hypothetical protein
MSFDVIPVPPTDRALDSGSDVTGIMVNSGRQSLSSATGSSRSRNPGR